MSHHDSWGIDDFSDFRSFTLCHWQAVSEHHSFSLSLPTFSPSHFASLPDRATLFLPARCTATERSERADLQGKASAHAYVQETAQSDSVQDQR